MEHFCSSRQTDISQIIFGLTLASTGVNLAQEVAAEVLYWVLTMRTGWPFNNYPSVKMRLQLVSGKSCCRREAISCIKNIYCGIIFRFMPWEEVINQEVNVDARSYFYSIVDSEWAIPAHYQPFQAKTSDHLLADA